MLKRANNANKNWPNGGAKKAKTAAPVASSKGAENGDSDDDYGGMYSSTQKSSFESELAAWDAADDQELQLETIGLGNNSASIY